MRVTTTELLLARLVTLLNFDFKTGTQKKLEEARLNVHELDRAGWQKTGAKLQDEIRLDLIPLLSDTPTDEFQERAKKLELHSQWQREKRHKRDKQDDFRLRLMTAGPRLYHGPRFYLDRLLEKINRIDLQFRWYAESGQHEWTVYDPDLSKPLSKTTGYPEPVPGTERKKSNPTMRLLGPERRITTIVGEKFIVARQLSHAKSFRELLYGTIAESLENGSFTKLRMCPQCGTFFVGEDLKRKFCGDRCKDQFFNSKKAKEGKFKQYRQQSKGALLAKARRLLNEGKSKAYVTEETGLSQRALERAGIVN